MTIDDELRHAANAARDPEDVCCDGSLGQLFDRAADQIIELQHEVLITKRALEMCDQLLNSEQVRLDERRLLERDSRRRLMYMSGRVRAVLSAVKDRVWIGNVVYCTRCAKPFVTKGGDTICVECFHD